MAYKVYHTDEGTTPWRRFVSDSSDLTTFSAV